MPSSSKAKGNTAERKAADQLSVWWGETFKRIPNSGALRWGGLVDCVYGDLLCPVSFPFVVECKHRANFDLLACLKTPNEKNLLGWWQQTMSDVVRCKAETGQDREPMLLAKGNRMTPVVCLSEALGSLCSAPIPSMKVVNPEVPTFYVFAMDPFLKAFNRGTIEAALAQLGHSTSGLQNGRSPS